MHKMWFSVLFFIIINGVFADRDCSNLGNLTNCDECFRCGGKWCKDPDAVIRCSKEYYRCNSKYREKPSAHSSVTLNGTFFYPNYRTTTVKSGDTDIVSIDFEYSTGNSNVTITANTTQTSLYTLTNSTACAGGRCTTTVHTTPAFNFCLPNGGMQEYINMTLRIDGVREEAVVEYRVPCACSCSKVVELGSPTCNRRGSFSCGVCTCDKEWIGKFCEEHEEKVEEKEEEKKEEKEEEKKELCEKNRGDVAADETCSGNGVFNACDQCECFVDRPGSRYFDKPNCLDLCQATNNFDECFEKPKFGRCEKRMEANLYYLAYNDSLLSESDMYGPLWVFCNITFDNRLIEYVAKKNGSVTYYMITTKYDPVSEERVVGAVNVTMPIVLGLVALAAATAATAAYLVWKNRAPPLPMTDPMYQNIDAEDCTGENPLYKPPTSSFKNPTYGKW